MLTCPFCKSQNSYAQLSCDACGQPLQRWRVIDLPSPGAAPLTVGDGCDDYFIDDAQRYRLLAPSTDDAGNRRLTVIDCQPKLGSPLQDLQKAWLEAPDLDVASHPLAVEVPAEAYPYLALQADYFPAIPEVHHAWRDSQRIILLIEDRTDWPLLTAAWDPLGEPLHHIQWLFETTLLWNALTPWHAQSTLLQPRRLTLNEGDLICLTQIDQLVDGPPLPLRSLGQLWQSLVGLCQPCLPLSVQELVTATAEGTVNSLARVQDVLAEAAQAYREPTPEGMTSAWGAEDWEDGLGPLSGPSDAIADLVIAAGLDEDFDPLDDDERDAATEADGMSNDDGEEDGHGDGNGLIEAPTMVLPMKLAQFDDSGQSHIGQQRRHNEDWFFTQTQLHKVSGPHGAVLRAKGLYILCDGMGGHASGEVASQLAVRTLRDYLTEHWGDRLPDHETLAQAVFTANQTIFDINQSKASSGVGRMGTTLVMVLVHNLNVAVVHVGDSRLYSYSKRLGLRQLTLDHEVGQREINRGVEPAIAYARPDAYQLTQALGPRGQEDMVPSIAYHEITEDTLLLLCSDGLSDNDLLERHIDTHIAGLLSSRVNLDNGVAQLIDLANEKNGHDNITTILVRIKLEPDMGSLGV
jgi:protein phosphatase